MENRHDGAEAAGGPALQEQHAELMRLIEAGPKIADVAEAMKQYEIPPYAVFTEETEVTYFAVGANA
jgi:hypothetical protein